MYRPIFASSFEWYRSWNRYITAWRRKLPNTCFRPQEVFFDVTVAFSSSLSMLNRFSMQFATKITLGPYSNDPQVSRYGVVTVNPHQYNFVVKFQTLRAPIYPASLKFWLQPTIKTQSQSNSTETLTSTCILKVINDQTAKISKIANFHTKSHFNPSHPLLHPLQANPNSSSTPSGFPKPILHTSK